MQARSEASFITHTGVVSLLLQHSFEAMKCLGCSTERLPEGLRTGLLLRRRIEEGRTAIMTMSNPVPADTRVRKKMPMMRAYFVLGH
jgi:hypothetical protein